MTGDNGFYTLKGYQLKGESGLTCAMEDYLEMLCRMDKSGKLIRLGELAGRLHVKPSSASKMMQQLKAAGYTESERYGSISLTEKGRTAGEYLIYRHEALHRFLCALNGTENEIEQVEKIEHFLERGTVERLDELAVRLEWERREEGKNVRKE